MPKSEGGVPPHCLRSRPADLQLPPLPVEAAGAAGVLTTPMASADHRLAALVAAFAFAQVRPATLAVVRPGRAALGAAATAATLSAAVAAAALVLPAGVERLVLRH